VEPLLSNFALLNPTPQKVHLNEVVHGPSFMGNGQERDLSGNEEEYAHNAHHGNEQTVKGAGDLSRPFRHYHLAYDRLRNEQLQPVHH
jgi:hypothetical protein